MSDGYCSECGLFFNVRLAECPRCHCCPECSAPVNGAAACSACGHPQDEDSVSSLEERLDAARPSNQDWAKELERDWLAKQSWSRVNWPLLTVVTLPVAVLFAVAWDAAINRFPLAGWRADISATLTVLLLWWIAVGQVRRGRWRWLWKKDRVASGG